MTAFQQAALNILEKHYSGDFDQALIFPLEVILSGAGRGDAGAIETGLRALNLCTNLLDVKPLGLADILTLN